ncbi:MAG: NAD-dependent epimerase/dehydratase family protein [Thermoplasmata archaeon]
MARKTLVVGGGGFVGRSIQRYVLEHRIEPSFAFTYLDSPDEVLEGLEMFQLDLLSGRGLDKVQDYHRAIYVAGNADHGLAIRHPTRDMDLNVRILLNLLEVFRGSLTMLSSQAVYYGLEGEIKEDVDHVPSMPYGLTKRMAEEYAKHAVGSGKLSRLWIFRLMYTFGMGERDTRLIPACSRATRGEARVTIRGGGQSFINPLPSWFVSRVLLKASDAIETKDVGFYEVTNINHPTLTRVSDVVKFLHGVKPFAYAVEPGGEEWPVRFHGNTDRLKSYFTAWGLKFPDLWESVREYYNDLNQEQVRV